MRGGVWFGGGVWRGKSLGYPAFAALMAGLVIVVALGLLIAIPVVEERGARGLSKVEIGPVDWQAVPLRRAVAEINRMIAESGEKELKV